MRTSTRTNGRGFTLIELLVVIGIVGILLGLLAPALRGARGAALQTVSLAHVRSVGQVMAAYAQQHGRHPYRGLGEYPPELPAMFDGFEPDPEVAAYVWYPGGVVLATTDHFEQAWLWPSVLVPLDEWPEHWETWVSPRKDRPLPSMEDFALSQDNPVRDQISIRYSHAFVARPELFSAARRGNNPDAWVRLLRPTRPDEVRYPASKVMLWDNDLAYLTGDPVSRVDGLLDAPTPMAFADGHGAVKNPTEAMEPDGNPLAEAGASRLADTKDGVQGRDYE